MSIKVPLLSCFDVVYDADTQTRTPNQVVMFCNGIQNTVREAEASAKLISQACFNTKVIVVHNPTTSLNFAVWDFSISGQKDDEGNLFLALALKIIDLVDKGKNRILIFAHSHGTFLTKGALELLNEDQHKLVDVVGFGGVTMIPKTLGKSVSNWVFHTDVLANIGNTCRRTDNPEGFKAFIRAKKIFASSYTPIKDDTEISELFEAVQSFNFAQHHIMMLPGKPLLHDLSKPEQQSDLTNVVQHNHFFKTYIDFFRNYLNQAASSQKEKQPSILSNIAVIFGSGFMSARFPKLRQHEDNSVTCARVGVGIGAMVIALVVGYIFRAVSVRFLGV